jgi:hypothetical protein
VIVPRSQLHLAIAAATMAVLFITGCTPIEPRPPGVSRRVGFSVTPLYPKSFEITAFGSRSVSAEELKDAWLKKAKLVANGHHFKASTLVVHDNEAVAYGAYWPMQTRSATGTIALTD